MSERSPIYKENDEAWADYILYEDLPEPALEALAGEDLTEDKILSLFAYSFQDDDYTHILVVDIHGRGWLVEGASLRPTQIRQL